MTDDERMNVDVSEWFEDEPNFLKLTTREYTVTEYTLWLMWQSRNRVLQALMKKIRELDESGFVSDEVMRVYEEAWNANVGGTFDYMLNWVRVLDNDIKNK